MREIEESPLCAMPDPLSRSNHIQSELSGDDLIEGAKARQQRQGRQTIVRDCRIWQTDSHPRSASAELLAVLVSQPFFEKTRKEHLKVVVHPRR